MLESRMENKLFGSENILKLIWGKRCCGSGMFIPDPESEFIHPGSRIQGQKDSEFASKNFRIFFLSSRISYTRAKKAPDPWSGSGGKNVQIYLKGVPLTPWAQMALLRRVSILTSAVPICFSANFLISCRHTDSEWKNWFCGGGWGRAAMKARVRSGSGI